MSSDSMIFVLQRAGQFSQLRRPWSNRRLIRRITKAPDKGRTQRDPA
ncbi:hypothetical protein AAFO90_18925 [Phaeobacter sp. CAU 1743]